jgi:multiple sugar transport system permease protein
MSVQMGVDTAAAREAAIQRGLAAARSKARQRLLLRYLGLAPFILFAAFPVYWMFITTFKEVNDLYNAQNFPFWFNMAPTLEHVNLLLRDTLFITWLANTFEISFFVVLITLLTAVPAGYALARLTFPGAENMGIAIFLTYLVPSSLLFIPLSRVVTQLGVNNTKWALVLVYPTFTIPFCTWLLMGFFKTVPREIEEAARVDGCSRAGAVIRVVLPVSRPGLMSVVIFAFTLAMQDFVYALTFVSAAAEKPVTLGVATDLVRGDIFFWGSLMAGALIVSVPVAILYSFFLDHFVAGITGGAVK